MATTINQFHEKLLETTTLSIVLVVLSLKISYISLFAARRKEGVIVLMPPTILSSHLAKSTR